MSVELLGGDVAQIRDGASTYRILGSNLATCGGQVMTTTTNAVAGLQDQLGIAQASLVSSVQAVSDESRSVISGFGGIAWTGANRAQVEEVGAELDARVTESTVRIQELFASFRADVDRLGAELNEVASQFNAVAAAAGESAVSVADAMDAQAVQLDEVMNTGVTRA
jgi:hypothetical protein